MEVELEDAEHTEDSREEERAASLLLAARTDAAGRQQVRRLHQPRPPN